jgi:hypothetical protein
LRGNIYPESSGSSSHSRVTRNAARPPKKTPRIASCQPRVVRIVQLLTSDTKRCTAPPERSSFATRLASRQETTFPNTTTDCLAQNPQRRIKKSREIISNRVVKIVQLLTCDTKRCTASTEKTLLHHASRRAKYDYRLPGSESAEKVQEEPRDSQQYHKPIDDN